MRIIEESSDPKFLKATALLLAKEVELVRAEIKMLRERYALDLQEKLSIEDQLLILRKKIFGTKSEKQDKKSVLRKEPFTELLLHNQPIETNRFDDKKERREIDAVEEVIFHELNETNCSKKHFEKLDELIGFFEESVEYDIIERRLKKIIHKRKKYKHQETGEIVVAPGSDKLNPGCHYSINFAIDVVMNKFSYHLPLERQSRIWEDAGFLVDKGTLYGLSKQLYDRLKAVAPLIREDILSHIVVHIDETPAKLKKPKTNGYLWNIANNRGVYQVFENSRSGLIAQEILKNFNGNILSDGYAGYNFLNKLEKVKLCHCWAHVRRKFFDSMENYPDAAQMILFIEELYRIEHEAKSFEQLNILRKEKSKNQVDKIFNWLVENKEKYLPKSSMGKAIQYALNHEKGLKYFLDNEQIPIDNNVVERSLRGPVLGRKNFQAYENINGADEAAVFYSIIETCKILKINSRDYMKEAVRRSIHQLPAITPSAFIKLQN